MTVRIIGSSAFIISRLTRHVPKSNNYSHNILLASTKCMDLQNYHPISKSVLASSGSCCIHTSPVWLKSKKNQKGKKYSNDDEDDDSMVAVEDEEEGLDIKGSKVMYLKVSSLRIDLVLKSAFQIARNKIETIFYESKIRVNGYKILKKSQNVALGDEIDIVKGFSTSNPNFLIVQRVKVLGASDSTNNDGNLTLKVRRYKSLTIDNYEEDEYKESSGSES